jgi:hypothetical protein
MRLHSDKIGYTDVKAALLNAQNAGKVSREVMFETFEPKGSRSRKNAWEIQLGWYGEKVTGDGRRWKNTGNRGADSAYNGNGCYAATYDEWGWFIAELYRMDSELIFGHYKTREVFDSMTRYAYGD